MGSTHPQRGHTTRPLSGVIPWVGAIRLLLAAGAVLLGAVLLVGCGSSDGDTDQTSSAVGGASAAGGGGGAQAVTIKDYIYRPATIAVPKGTTVTFTNHDTTAHTATSKQAGAFESGPIDTGKSAKVTLEKTGTFAYYCLFHPFMKGTIIVE
jgi:plastocyanin